ncbi:MAG: hypothetical protein V4648_07935 [Bacteroidota bacterium]
MQIIARKFLKIHGILLTLLGVVFAIVTTIGRLIGRGPFAFLQQNEQASVGLFEAYLLIAVCGVILLFGATQVYTPKWNRIAALVHIPLVTTNLLYWDFYAQVGMQTIGIVSTVMHFVLIIVECFFGFKKKD